MTRWLLITAWIFVGAHTWMNVTSSHAATPNIVLIIADDCTYRDLEVYGGQAKTPHLNRLAREGMTFQNCFQAAPMCSPTRHCLYTGLYPVKSGAYPNHTMAHDWVESIASYLQSAGYRTALSGKTHIQPRTVFPFQYSSSGNNPDFAVMDRVVEECAKDQTPFLFIVASNEPHSPWDKGDASAYPPESLDLSPVMVDSPDTREAYSRYLAEITYFDSQVGEALAVIDKHDQHGNTLVIALSEQGNSFPFAKWTCYDAGLQSACIVRWPGKVQPASRSEALIEYVDVVPTFLEAVGLERPDVLDGKSFLPVLIGETTSHKSHVFGLQTTRGINFGSEYFGIRSVRDAQYRYVLNFTPEIKFQNAATRDSTFETWQAIAAAGDAHAQALVEDYQHRPAEELYDCVADPWNRKNLIGDPELVSVRDRLRSELDQWMNQQGDEGQATEMKALARMPKKLGDGSTPAAAGNRRGRRANRAAN